MLSTRESFIDATMIYLPTWFTAQYCSVLSGQSEMSGRNGSLHLFDQSFAQRKHYVYSQAERSKLSCCLDRGPGSFDVGDATTLSWSSAAVSECDATGPMAEIFV